MSTYTDPRRALLHKGTKGMRWGYNDGKRNGKRTAKDYIKDVLGYDERDAKESAEKQVKDIERNREHYQYMSDKIADIYVNDGFPEGGSKDTMRDWYNNYRDAYKKSTSDLNTAQTKARNAIKNYEKTPLSKIEKMVEAVDSGKKWLRLLFK